MKNLVLVLVSIFLVGCSSDDKDAENPSVDNYVSNINVNLQSFQPSNSAADLYTNLFTGINDGEANRREFYMRQVDNGINTGNKFIDIKIVYPTNQPIFNCRNLCVFNI